MNSDTVASLDEVVGKPEHTKSFVNISVEGNIVATLDWDNARTKSKFLASMETPEEQRLELPSVNASPKSWRAVQLYINGEFEGQPPTKPFNRPNNVVFGENGTKFLELVEKEIVDLDWHDMTMLTNYLGLEVLLSISCVQLGKSERLRLNILERPPAQARFEMKCDE